MAREYDIQKHSGQCGRCERVLADGEEFLSALFAAADGIARTREAKLGALFTQTTFDEKGNPIRDPDSTTYVGRIESVDTFGPRLYAQAQSRGLANAGQAVVIGDGAQWIWNMADEHFGGATQILDYYHAAEHLSDLAKTLFPNDDQKRKEWLRKA